MDFVAPVVTPVVESIMEVIKRHLGYLVSSTNIVNEMRTNMEELNAMARVMKTKKETNVANDLVVPHYVPVWLKEVERISVEVGTIPTGRIGCFSMKTRYKVGKRSSDILMDVKSLKEKKSEIEWSDDLKPLGRVRSTRPSTFETVGSDIDTQKVIKSSRELIFDEALKALEPNNECQMMALCGMGGVGKSTMMEQLKKVAEDRSMFDLVVKVVIGKSKNKMMIQEAVAENIGRSLSETDEDNRAESLHKRFEGVSEDGTKKILVILDDLWEELDLKDIGLTTPFPKGFKLLLTSRDERVCTKMGVEPSSIFRMVVFEDPEAKELFWEIAGIVSDSEHDLVRIGEEIVKKCGGLPIAIATIATTLRDNKDKETWKDALDRFLDESSHYLDNIFEISYNHLKDDEEKATFLLSGLFPDDHNIRIEDLTRCGWGLKLFKNLNSISKARRRMKACVGNLIRSNLLIESDSKGYVKIHDLVRDFVLTNLSNVKQASLVNNDNISDQLKRDSYERILIKCGDMVDFPADFNHPNLALLNLMDGEELTKFPEDFYTRMQKLEVVAYAGIDKPLLPRHLTTLRTLCLASCKSMGDISFLGDLINLEVLSLAFCGISNLPSAIGKLKRLQLLDLTGCVDLCIGDGVFQSLERLSELYMRASEGKPIRFTEDNCEGLKMVSSKLTALEVEFFESILQPKNVSFKKLERFRISVGIQLGVIRSENTNILKLVASSKEILECKINELFEKTEILELSVNGMSSLEDISRHPSQYSFCNLKGLSVYGCADLTCIFTVNVVRGLTKLTTLIASKCPLLVSLVKGDNSGSNKAIKFPDLEFLELRVLPLFVSFCTGDELLDLPQLMELRLDVLPNVTCIFSKVLIPKLERLEIFYLPNLKEIWCDTGSSSSSSLVEVHNISMLRAIVVSDCDSMVNLFPTNPMRLLPHLETLVIDKCSSLEVLFNIDLQGCVGGAICSSSLRYIHVFDLKNLREVWRIKGGDNNSGIIIRDFQCLRELTISQCDNFVSIFTPTTIYFDMGALETIEVTMPDYLTRYDQTQQIIHAVAIPSSLLHTSNQLPHITLDNYRVEVVFDMKSQSSRDSVTTYNPNQLRSCKLILRCMKQMTHVWKCNWNEYFIRRNQHPTSLFCNIMTIKLTECKSIKYLFSPLMGTLLSNLKKVKIINCIGMEEVVSNRDDDDDDGKDENEKMITTSTTLFPHLDLVTLHKLPILKHVGGGVAKGKTNIIHDQLKTPSPSFGSISSYPAISLQDVKEINLENRRSEVIVASNELLHLQNLEKIHAKRCVWAKKIFEVDGEFNNVSQTTIVVKLPKLRQVDLEELKSLEYLWENNKWRQLDHE